MEEINLKDLFKFFIDKIFVIILLTLIVCFSSLIYNSFIKTPMYKSSTTLLLTQANDSNVNTTITQNDITLNQKLVTTYSEIITSKKILKQVISELKLNLDVDGLREKITVSAVNDTEIIKITVTDKDAMLAKEIANSIAKIFSSEIVDIYNIQNICIIDVAEASSEAYNMNLAKEVVISFVIGIVLSLGVVFVLYYFDTTVKSSEEIEQKLQLPILSSVPIVVKRGNKNDK